MSKGFTIIAMQIKYDYQFVKSKYELLYTINFIQVLIIVLRGRVTEGGVI